jgi:hypothetical protein
VDFVIRIDYNNYLKEVHLRNAELIELLREEKRENSEELRYYASFMFKYLPITGSLLLAIFGYALNENGQLIFVAIPLIVNIFAAVFQNIDYNMILLDGYIRILEESINQLVKKKIFQKNSYLVSNIYGGKNQRLPISFILLTLIISLIILTVYVLSALYAFTVIREINYHTISWIYIGFCTISVIIQVLSYFIMHKRIIRLLNSFKSSLGHELKKGKHKKING